MNKNIFKGSVAAAALVVTPIAANMNVFATEEDPTIPVTDPQTNPESETSEILNNASAEIAEIKGTDADLEKELLLTTDENVVAYEEALKNGQTEVDTAQTEQNIADTYAGMAQDAYDEAQKAALEEQTALDDERDALLSQTIQDLSRLEEQERQNSADLAEKNSEIEEAQAAADAAQAQYEAAVQAMQQAQQALDEFNQANPTIPTAEELSELQAKAEDASAALQTAQQNAADSQAAYEAAQTDLQNASSAMESLQQQVDDLNAQCEDLKAQLAQAKAQAEAAQAAYQEALQAQESAQEIIASAQTAADAAKKAADEAAAAFEQAQKEADAATQTLETAKSEASQAAADLQTAKNELNSAKETLQKAEQNLSQAKADVAAAQQEVETQTAALQDINMAKEQYQKDLEAAAQKTEQAKQALEAAKAMSSDEEAKAAYLQQYQAALDQALAAYNQGALGFYQYLVDCESLSQEKRDDAALAIEILTSEPLTNYVNLGQDGDTTKLENVLIALKNIVKGNELRSQEVYDPEAVAKAAAGELSEKELENYRLKTLGISSSLMAISQKQTNWAISNISHSAAYPVGENLCWGRANPYDGWYTIEKNNWNTNNGEPTGHYLNLCSASYVVTGAAHSNTGGKYVVTDGQVFDWPSSSAAAAVMSAELYQSLFNSYYLMIMDAVSTAQNNLKTADAGWTTNVQGLIDEAQSAYQKAADAEEQLKSQGEPDVHKVQAALDAANANLQAARTAQNEAQTAKKTAAADVSAKEAALPAKEKAAQDTAAAQSAAQSAANTALQKKTASETALAQAQEASQQADAALQAALKANGDIDELYTAATDAEDLVNALSQSLAETEAKSVKAQEELDAAKEAAKQAADTEAALKTAAEADAKAVAEATSSKEKADAALEQGTALAKQSAELNKANAEAQEEVQSLTEAKEKALAALEEAKEGLSDLQEQDEQLKADLEELRALFIFIKGIGDPNNSLKARSLKTDAIDLNERYIAFLNRTAARLNQLNLDVQAAQENQAAKTAAAQKALADLEALKQEYTEYLNQLIAGIRAAYAPVEEETKDPAVQESVSNGSETTGTTIFTQDKSVFTSAVPTDSKSISQAVNTGVQTSANLALLAMVTALGAVGFLQDEKRRNRNK